MIEFIDVTLTLNRKTILSSISVSIPDTDKTVLIGKSGCGKTMLIKTLEGLYRPDSGRIIIDGEELNVHGLHKRNPLLQKIAMLFQNAAMLDSFTVYQNVALPLFEKHELPPEAITKAVQEVLEFVSLWQSKDLFPSELSGGMRKRIGLARALVTNPKYLILDEPTTGLDPITAGEVVSFLKLVIKDKQVIPITITHDPFCINELGSHIIIMNEGKVLYQGNKQAIAAMPDSAIRRFYDSFFDSGSPV
jgi:phospholipid/cholesterol/gamma-HCH transport system ATP-binding protein